MAQKTFHGRSDDVGMEARPVHWLARLARLVYGQDVENAIVAEDSESAITVRIVGDMMALQCDHACENLPGMFWESSVNMPNPT